ncbi:sugar phosphate isomerase/epimerase [Mucilaginibacter sp. SMC90]|uniref:sugar phosphate isomerase/epimerase family protein n=1 Tax=Mucilaginibacter sp. SMC90 TaxID=2929803 RepID=UPI001FB1D7A1|nr:TIM barrel protein [Mucilaginibacter sp. SMC90]UOE51030.1 sugar phosphate isomerase/epimerase [Mucilaginibacter sp. SMC90]
MILGISSFTYGWSVGGRSEDGAAIVDENILIDRVLQFALRCLQIGDNLPLHLFDKERIGRFCQRLRKNDIRTELGARGLTEGHLDRYISLAEKLNAPLLRFVIDAPGFEPDSGTVIATVKNVVSTLKSKGIALGIENHDRFKARELAGIIDAVGDTSVGICLDCVNSIGAGEGLEHVLQVLAPYTVNLHIKDFLIKRLPHQMGFTVTGSPAGKGMLDVDTLVDTLSRYSLCQSAILEQWVVPEDTVKATMLKEQQWAEAGIDFLKSTKYFSI